MSSGASLLVIIGPPYRSTDVQLIIDKLTSDLLKWDTSLSGVDLDNELEFLRDLFDAPLNKDVRSTSLHHSSDSFQTTVLINPVLSKVRQQLAQFFTSSKYAYRHLVYAGCSLHGSGCWLLRDGVFSYGSFASLISSTKPDGGNGSNHVVLSIFEEGPWSVTSVSKVLADSHVVIHDSRKSRDDVASARQSQFVTEFVGKVAVCLSYEDEDALMPQAEQNGALTYAQPTIYVFPAGDGSALFFGINDFNFAFDSGSGRCAEFWNFLSHIQRLDVFAVSNFGQQNLFATSSLLSHVRNHKNSMSYPQIGQILTSLPVNSLAKYPTNVSDSDLSIHLPAEAVQLCKTMIDMDVPLLQCPGPVLSSAPTVVSLYHKIGVGSADLYVISPTQDGREMKEIAKQCGTLSPFNLNNASQLLNAASMCAALVWKPFSAHDRMVRVLYPGSAPVSKVFEGLERLRGNALFERYSGVAETALLKVSSLSAKPQPVKVSMASKPTRAAVQTKPSQKAPVAKPVAEKAKPKEAVVATAGKTSHQPAAAAAATTTTAATGAKNTSSTAKTANAKSLSKTVMNKPPAAKSPAAAAASKLNTSDIVSGPVRSEVIASASPFAAKELSSSSPASKSNRRVKSDHNKSCSEDEPPLLVNIGAPVGDAVNDVIVSRDLASDAPAEVEDAARVKNTPPSQQQDDFFTDVPLKEERENSVSNGLTGAAGEQIDVALANNDVETNAVEIGHVGNGDEHRSPMHVVEEIGSELLQNEAAAGDNTPTTLDNKFELDKNTVDDAVAIVSVESEIETAEKDAFIRERTSVDSVNEPAADDILEPVNNEHILVNGDDQHQFTDDSKKLIDDGAQLGGEVASVEGDNDFSAQPPSDVINDADQVPNVLASVKPEVGFNKYSDATAVYGSSDDDAQIKSVAADVVEAAAEVTTPKLEEHSVDFDDFQSEQTRNSIPSSPAEDDSRKPEDRCWSEHDAVVHEQVPQIDSQTDVNNETHIFGREDDETRDKQLRTDLTELAVAESIGSADPDREFQPSVDSIQTEPVDERIVAETSTSTHTEPLFDLDVVTSSNGELVQTNDDIDGHVEEVDSEGSHLTKQFEEIAEGTYAKQDERAAADTELYSDNNDDVISHVLPTDADRSSSLDTTVDALSTDAVEHHSVATSLELEPAAGDVSDVNRCHEPAMANYLQQPVNDLLSVNEDNDDVSVKLTSSQDVITEGVDYIVDDTGVDSANAQAEQVAESARSLQLDEDLATEAVNSGHDDVGNLVERQALENVESVTSEEAFEGRTSSLAYRSGALEATTDDVTGTANHRSSDSTGYEIADEMSRFEDRVDHADVADSSSNVVPSSEVDGHHGTEVDVPVVDEEYPEQRQDVTDYGEHETDWRTGMMKSEKCYDDEEAEAKSDFAYQLPQQDLMTSCENVGEAQQSLLDKLDDERHVVAHADDDGLDDAVTQHERDDVKCSPPVNQTEDNSSLREPHYPAGCVKVHDSSDDVIDSNTAEQLEQPMPDVAWDRNSDDVEVPADEQRDSNASEGNEFADSTLAAADVVSVESDQQDRHRTQTIGETIEETEDLNNQAGDEIIPAHDELQHQHVESIDDLTTYSRPDTNDVDIGATIQDYVVDDSDVPTHHQSDDARYQTTDAEAENMTRTGLSRDDEHVGGCADELERWNDGRGIAEDDAVVSRERQSMAADGVDEHTPGVNRNDSDDVGQESGAAAVDSGVKEEPTREEVPGDLRNVEEHAEYQRHEDQHQEVNGSRYHSRGTDDLQETQLTEEAVDDSGDAAVGEIYNDDTLFTSATTNLTSDGAAVTSSELVSDAASNSGYGADGVETAYGETTQPAHEAQTELVPPHVEVAPSDNDSSKNHVELLTPDSSVGDFDTSAAANAPSWDGTRKQFFVDDSNAHPPEQNGSAFSGDADLPGVENRSTIDHPFQTFVGRPCDFDPSAEWDEPMGLPAPTPAANTSQHGTAANKSRRVEETSGKSAAASSKSSAAAMAAAKSSAAVSTSSSTSPSHNVSKTASPSAKKSIKTVPATDGDKGVARRTGSEPRQVTSASGGRSVSSPLYFDVVYIPTDMADVGIEFFRSVRARHYVISSTQPPRQLLDAVVEGKKLWLADNHDVAMNALTTYVIPTYRSPVVDQWYSETQTQLHELNIILQPAANEHQLQIGSQYCTSYKLTL